MMRHKEKGRFSYQDIYVRVWEDVRGAILLEISNELSKLCNSLLRVVMPQRNLVVSIPSSDKLLLAEVDSTLCAITYKGRII